MLCRFILGCKYFVLKVFVLFFRSISFKITQRLFCAHLCKLWHTLTRRETSISLNLVESKNMDAHGNLPADLDMPEQWWNASWPLNQGQVVWDLPTLPLHSWYSDWHLWSRFCSAGKKNGTQFSSTVNAVPGTRLSNKVWSPSQEVNEKIPSESSEWKYHLCWPNYFMIALYLLELLNCWLYNYGCDWNSHFCTCLSCGPSKNITFCYVWRFYYSWVLLSVPLYSKFTVGLM